MTTDAWAEADGAAEDEWTLRRNEAAVVIDAGA